MSTTNHHTTFEQQKHNNMMLQYYKFKSFYHVMMIIYVTIAIFIECFYITVSIIPNHETSSIVSAFTVVTPIIRHQQHQQQQQQYPLSNRFEPNTIITPYSSSSVKSLTKCMAWRLIGKYFQIEEMEDRDSCTTEVILNENSTITTLETNGPLHINATGVWKLDKITGDFIMTLYRTYEGGRDSKVSTNIGIFTFTTVRKFIGRLYNIGIKQGISGNIYDVSDDPIAMDINDDTIPISELRKVGFFEMIDTTLSEDGEVTLRGRTRSM